MNLLDKEKNLLWTPAMPREQQYWITTVSPKWVLSAPYDSSLSCPTVFHPTLENGKKAARIQNLEELHFGFYFLARWLPLGFLGPYPPGFLFPYHWTCIELFNEHKLCARPTVTPVISVTTFNPHAHPLRWILLTSFYRWSDIYKC